MDGAINFTIGLSEGIAWPWPIAVYLFLAGISGGAVAVALMLNFFRHKTETTPIIKSASIIGLATILLGMLCLVLDLTNPLYFWRISGLLQPDECDEYRRHAAALLYPAGCSTYGDVLCRYLQQVAAVRLG